LINNQQEKSLGKLIEKNQTEIIHTVYKISEDIGQ